MKQCLANGSELGGFVAALRRPSAVERAGVNLLLLTISILPDR